MRTIILWLGYFAWNVF